MDHRYIVSSLRSELTTNDFIGGLSMKVGEVLDFTKERPLSSWFKLLDEKRTKTANERLLADDEAVKVREDGVK